MTLNSLMELKNTTNGLEENSHGKLCMANNAWDSSILDGVMRTEIELGKERIFTKVISGEI